MKTLIEKLVALREARNVMAETIVEAWSPPDDFAHPGNGLDTTQRGRILSLAQAIDAVRMTGRKVYPTDDGKLHTTDVHSSEPLIPKVPDAVYKVVKNDLDMGVGFAQRRARVNKVVFQVTLKGHNAPTPVLEVDEAPVIGAGTASRLNYGVTLFYATVPGPAKSSGPPAPPARVQAQPVLIRGRPPARRPQHESKKKRRLKLSGKFDYEDPGLGLTGVTTWAKIGDSRKKLRKVKSKSTAYAYVVRPSFGYMSTASPLGYS